MFYTVVEVGHAPNRLQSVRVFKTATVAEECFNRCCAENRVGVWSKDELKGEMVGTIAAAGGEDDGYSVHLMESTLL